MRLPLRLSEKPTLSRTHWDQHVTRPRMFYPTMDSLSERPTFSCEGTSIRYIYSVSRDCSWGNRKYWASVLKSLQIAPISEASLRLGRIRRSDTTEQVMPFLPFCRKRNR